MARIIVNKEFKTRGDLDSYVTSRFGKDESKNSEHVIELSEAEMATLSLSEDNSVYGVHVVKATEQAPKVK